MTAECVLKDGVWLSHFGFIEGASLVEYKYAINSQKGIARIRRVLVEGPEDPFYTAPGAKMLVVRGPFPGENDQYFQPCRYFLLIAGHLAALKKELATGAASERLAAAWELSDLAYFNDLSGCLTDVAPELQNALADQNDYVRFCASCALCEIDGARLLRCQRANLVSADKLVRQRTIAILRYFGGPRNANEAFVAIRDRDLDVRCDAARTLEAIQPDYVAAAIRGLRDRDAEGRAAAAWALGQYGSAAANAVGDLKGLLNDENTDVRRSAGESLARIGKAVNVLENLRKWVPLRDARGLGKALLYDDRAVRQTAVAALIAFGPDAREAVPELRAVLRNEASDIRQQALVALRKMGSAAKAAVPELAHIASHVTDDVWTKPYALSVVHDLAEANRRVAAEILDSLGPDAAEGVPQLCGALRDPRTSMRQSAARLLGRIGPKAKATVPELRYALSDPASLVRESAAEACVQSTLAPRTLFRNYIMHSEDANQGGEGKCERNQIRRRQAFC